jgi:ectoine hydroxylase-related dioxygenase (phytanoyl-CoA dioxygenase family)
MRSDIDVIVSQVEADGVCVVPDFISSDLLAQIRTSVDTLNVAERASGNGFLESEGVNQRVFNLVNKGEAFEQIVQHEDVMAAMGKLLGGDFILSGFSSNTTGPGGEEMVLHSDSGYVPPPHPEYLLSANAVWMIDDFTEENGGTRYVPGSHKLRDNPRPDGEYPTVPIIGKAGSVAFLHGYTWHKRARMYRTIRCAARCSHTTCGRSCACRRITSCRCARKYGIVRRRSCVICSAAIYGSTRSASSMALPPRCAKWHTRSANLACSRSRAGRIRPGL